MMRPPAVVWKCLGIAVFLSFGLMMSPVVGSRAARVVVPLQIYHYNFESDAADWELQPGIWSRVPSPEGGYALRGTGHGFARLTAHSGEVSSLRFRFRMENLQSDLHANVLESFATGHTRYFVSFGMQGVGISRQQGSSFQDLGQQYVPIAPGVFYEAKILVGGGSMDVFLNGEGIVGVDDPSPPPPGYVSFESLDNSVVYVDDVEVQIGPEPAPHARAPRPPLSLPLGPDVGPFVGGIHTGDISLAGNTILTLSQGRYTLKAGNIKLNYYRLQAGRFTRFSSGHTQKLHRIPAPCIGRLEVDLDQCRTLPGSC